jgi:hypothetical protein
MLFLQNISRHLLLRGEKVYRVKEKLAPDWFACGRHVARLFFSGFLLTHGKRILAEELFGGPRSKGAWGLESSRYVCESDRDAVAAGFLFFGRAWDHTFYRKMCVVEASRFKNSSCNHKI